MFNYVSLQELHKAQQTAIANDSALHLSYMTASLHQ
jgi:hypothetical protein